MPGFIKKTDPAGNKTVDLEKFPTAAKLVKRCHEFFGEMEDL